MYTLFMVLVIWHGNSSTGGPIVKDGFKSEAACMAYAKKLQDTLVPQYDRGGALSPNTRNRFEQVSCVKMD